MADAAGKALRAAAEAVAKVTRIIAARHTREGAAAVNIVPNGDGLSVRVGSPTGRWGWTPIQAWMLDNNGRHPYYGDRRIWYMENRGGSVGLITTPASGDVSSTQAAKEFADVFVQEIFGD